MPTREQLIAAGRQDLVAYIIEAGGFLEVSSEAGPAHACHNSLTLLLTRF
jgi:hypothetical protein